MIDWADKKAITFDCFGTLVDWETGILGDLKSALVTRSGKNPSTYYDDDELLRFYGQAEPAAQGTPFKSYREVLKLALLRIADAGHLKIQDPEVLVKGIALWPIFTDVPDALARLKSRYKIALVTNCDQDLLEGVAPRLHPAFDAIVTSDQVGAYKPSPRLLEEALRRLDVPKSGLVHAAQSFFHDIEPAKALGLATVHVDRRAGRPGGATPRPTTPVAPDLKVQNLVELCQHAGV
jgi:2-haloacid dehalogenase